MTSPLIPLVQMMNISGKTSIDKLISGGTLTDVTAGVRSTDGRIEAEGISAKMYGGTFTGSAHADLSKTHGPYPAKVDLKLTGGQATVFSRISSTSRYPLRA